MLPIPFVLDFILHFDIRTVLICADFNDATDLVDALARQSDVLLGMVESSEMQEALAPLFVESNSLLLCSVNNLPDQFDFGEVSSMLHILLEGQENGYPELFKTLRLDSKVFTFKADGGVYRIHISELYAIKGTLISGDFGHWSRRRGLSVKQPNIWERRRNLRGIQLKDAWMPWKPLRKRTR